MFGLHEGSEVEIAPYMTDADVIQKMTNREFWNN